MPAMDVLSGNQLQAVSGRRGRPVLGDLLLAARADLPGRMAFQQRERDLALQEQEQQLQAQSLAVQERAQREAADAQRRGQRQQVLGTAISGVGQAAQVGLLAKETGVLSSLGIGGGAASGATALGGGSAPATVTLTGAAAEAVPVSAATPVATGSLGTLAAGAGVAAVGAGAGYGLSKAPIPRYGRALSGAAAGVGTGALAGTFVFPGIGTAAGAIIGGIAGGLTGGLCIILTACAENADEIALAKRYRERFMSTEAKRGYYMLAEPVAARMQADAAYCHHIRRALVLPLLRYAGHELGEADIRPSVEDQEVSMAFLDLCEFLGRSVRQYVRDTGEVV